MERSLIEEYPWLYETFVAAFHTVRRSDRSLE